jgi:Holliday junction DNA helicase RuvB
MGRGPYIVGDFVGQRKVMMPILRIQDGAIARGEAAPHMLFQGPSGTGKSMGADTLRKRAGTTVTKFLNATVGEIVDRLTTLKASDIVFFDECHNLANDVQEMLFEVIDSDQVPGQSASPNASTEPIKIQKLTLIFATDQPGKLLNALIKRIPLTVQFRLYSTSELKEIVARIAARRKILLSAQAARQLASACNGLPRRAEHHVNNLRLSFADSERRQLGIEDVRDYLTGLGLDEHGLGTNERKYLRFLRRNKVASLESLAGHLGTDSEYVKSQVEQQLRFRGLIAVGRNGRVLTKKGREWVRSQASARERGAEQHA